jgi:hypothetical protein
MLHWLWLLLALLLFGVSGLFGPPEQPTCAATDGCGPVVDAWTPVVINGHEGVVLSPGAVPEMLGSYGMATQMDDTWVPAEADLRAAEDELAQHMARTPGLGAEMLDARRQYGGFVEDGERKIFVNSFCADFDDWRSDIVYVLDGGSCFWQAVYNVDSGTIELIWVNFAV